MTLANFQASLAELVADGQIGASELDEVERQRLATVAGTRGVATMRMLYMSWRLTKALSLLPLTLKALGDERTAALLRAFWKKRKATSLHFVEECLDFAAYLRAGIESPPPFFADILAFETARLEMRMQQSLGLAPDPQRVRFCADPTALFAALQEGRDLGAVARAELVLRGELREDGSESWIVEGGGVIALAPQQAGSNPAF